MWTVGIDAHHGVYVNCVKNENGKTIQEKTIRGGPADVAAFVGGLGRPVRVCYEASLSYGILHDTLAPVAKKIEVAHPGRTRLIFATKRKNDRIDAEKLAFLSFMRQVPAVHVPKPKVRYWRGLIEHRRRTVQRRVTAKNAVRALLRSLAIAPPRRVWNRTGLEWLRTVELPSPLLRLRLNQLLDEVELLTASIAAAEEELDKPAARHAGVKLLQTIPGVGPRTAETFMAYVDKPQRFRSARKAAAYFGLIPLLDESADKKRYGHITREGPSSVRQYLVEAAWQAVRLSPTLKAMFLRIGQGRKERRGIALVAVARHLAEVMLAMLRDNKPWREMVESPPPESSAPAERLAA